MTSIRESIKRLVQTAKPLPAGIHHYQAPPEDPRNYRLHLRVERDGTGILIINASTVLHLNKTATEFAYHLVNETQDDKVVEEMASRYRVSKSKILQDYREFIERIEALINQPDLDPITYLDFDRQKPYSGDLSAPYRLDCAITYRLPETADPESAPIRRVTRELSTEEWQSILDKAWQAGIPHIIFTGGEPTLREDLPELLESAETNGQVTGLLTDGLCLADKDLLNTLLQTGLDHLLIILQPGLEKAWEAIGNALEEDIFTAVHITISAETKGQISQIIQRLAQMNVAAISLSAAPGLLNNLQNARQLVADLNLSLIWDLPVPYSALNPIALEVEPEETPQGAGKAWLYVEPDGDVLPNQGINQVLGNFLNDPWEKIWR
jgi:hypothetical protein